MNYSGIDFGTIMTYVQLHHPGAVPYLQFIVYWLPPIAWVLGQIAKRLPDPDTQYDLFSDDAIVGKLPSFWLNPIDKLVKFSNQFVILINYILTTRLYALVYRIIAPLGQRISKEPSKKMVISPPDIPSDHELAELADTVTNADNLTPAEIQRRTKLLADELEKASPKIIRTIAAQSATRVDVIKATPAKPENVVPLTPAPVSVPDDKTRSVS